MHPVLVRLLNETLDLAPDPWARWFAGLTVVVLFIQAGILWAHRNLFRNQESILREAQELTKAEQRPWVGLDAAQNVPGRDVLKRIPLKNAGSGPALKVRIAWGTLDLLDTEELTLQQICEGKTQVEPITNLLPGSTFDIHGDFTRSGTMDHQIHVFGEITYEDHLHDCHHTRFARRFDPIAGVWLYEPIFNEMT